MADIEINKEFAAWTRKRFTEDSCKLLAEALVALSSATKLRIVSIGFESGSGTTFHGLGYDHDPHNQYPYHIYFEMNRPYRISNYKETLVTTK
jgi:hypothetical protein